MPHVVIEGSLDLAEFARSFEPILLRREGDVLRADALYLERGGRSLLLEALVVEAGRKASFYIKIAAHDRGSVTVRVDPMTHPDRSAGVRELVARVGQALLAFAPQARLARANVVIPSPSAQAGEEQ